jgi:hypothetical protein
MEVELDVALYFGDVEGKAVSQAFRELPARRLLQG